MSGVSAVV